MFDIGRGSWGRGLMTLLLLILVVLGGAWLINRDITDPLNIADQKKIATSQSQLISRIAEKVGPSVVSINTAISDNFALTGAAAGTGIILSEDGLIITNRHVVPQAATAVTVVLSDGTELEEVSVIGRTGDNDSLDVAFLKINDTEGRKLKATTLGKSAEVKVGDNVIAIGNALGQFQNTVTSGIISGYGRSVQARDSSGSLASAENLDNLFQTDAAINEGNSGGPLVNLNGQVIGINTAVASNSQNIGFAIPIDDVRGLIEQVIEDGKFERPYLGVRYVPLTADIAAQFKLKTTNGAFIIPSDAPETDPSVIPGSPAAKAGLKERDVITAVDGHKINSTHSLVSRLTVYKPGDKIKLTVQRGDKRLQVTVTLGRLPSS